MYNKRKQIVILVVIIICVGVLLQSVRWDKVPVLGGLILGFEKSFTVNACVYDYPITHDMICSEPKDWPSDEGYWFDFINAYSLRLLRKYMKKNQLAIVPNWYRLENTMRLEELIEVLDFVKVETKERFYAFPVFSIRVMTRTKGNCGGNVNTPLLGFELRGH